METKSEMGTLSSHDVISRIVSIYDRYSLPPNLRFHMYRVAAIAQFILKHWTGKRLDYDDVLAACLLHDVGNLAKMELYRPEGIAMLGPEVSRLNHWRKARQEFVEQYGSDDRFANLAVIRELGVSARVFRLVEHKEVEFNSETLASDDDEQKIVYCCDERAGPHGILSIRERFDDVYARYKHLPHSIVQHPDYFRWRDEAVLINKQVFAQTTVASEDLTDAAIAPFLEVFCERDTAFDFSSFLERTA